MGFLDYTVFLAVLWRGMGSAHGLMAFGAAARPSIGGRRSLHNWSSNVLSPPSSDLPDEAHSPYRSAPAAGWLAHRWDRGRARYGNSVRPPENYRGARERSRR